MQSYDVVLQMPGNEADAVPWERIQKKNGAFELPRNENIAFDDHSIPEFDLDRF
jgi:hypothetical protein